MYTRSDGQKALLHHSMHVLMENRHGLGIDIRVGKADGHAERKCSLKMLDRVKRRSGIEPTTLGAGKGYHAADFLLELEKRGIEPHVSCRSKKPLDVQRERDEGGRLAGLGVFELLFSLPRVRAWPSSSGTSPRAASASGSPSPAAASSSSKGSVMTS